MGLVGALAGCLGLFGPSSLPIGIEVLSQGEKSLELPIDSPTVRPAAQQVVMEVMETFSTPGYAIRAKAHIREQDGAVPQLLVDVVTHEPDGIYILVGWFRRYRLTVGEVPAGAYAVRLLWRNDFNLPAYRLRVLVDTTVTVPP